MDGAFWGRTSDCRFCPHGPGFGEADPIRPRVTANSPVPFHLKETSVIRNSTPRAATLNDVGQLAGVSAATVSRALSGFPKISEATRQRVMDAIQKLDYRPNLQARALALGRVRNTVTLPMMGKV